MIGGVRPAVVPWKFLPNGTPYLEFYGWQLSRRCGVRFQNHWRFGSGLAPDKRRQRHRGPGRCSVDAGELLRRTLAWTAMTDEDHRRKYQALKKAAERHKRLQADGLLGFTPRLKNPEVRPVSCVNWTQLIAWGLAATIGTSQSTWLSAQSGEMPFPTSGNDTKGDNFNKNAHRRDAQRLWQIRRGPAEPHQRTIPDHESMLNEPPRKQPWKKKNADGAVCIMNKPQTYRTKLM